MSEKNYEIIRKGTQISEEMKKDVLDIYFKFSESQYSSRSEHMRHKLEEKYGRCWSIMVLPVDIQFSYSFLHAEDLLFEFNTGEHIVIAYLAPLPLPPPFLNEPRTSEIIRPEIRREFDYPDYYRYSSPAPVYVSPPRISRPAYSPPRFYDGPRRIYDVPLRYDGGLYPSLGRPWNRQYY